MKQIKEKRPLSKRHSDGKTPAPPEDLTNSVGLERAESAFQPPPKDELIPPAPIKSRRLYETINDHYPMTVL